MRSDPVIHPSLWLASLVGVLVTVMAVDAAAGQPNESQPRLFGGQLADTCEWSMVPAFNTSQSGCTATLIHPQMIATAAHCVMGQSHPTLLFGEEALHAEHTIGLTYCWYAPAFNAMQAAFDVAFCTLPEPLDMPYIPPAFGCELERLTEGTEVTLVGYGDPNWGRKTWKTSVLGNSPSMGNVALIGGSEAGNCSGDSGGPALIQLDDGSWRIFAVAAGYIDPCGSMGPSYHAWTHDWIPWIEGESGLDLTPCHDVDGTWNPTPLCRGFVVDPWDPGQGDWGEWCAGAEVSGPGQSCGSAMEPDTDPPHVEIVAPADQAVYAGPMGMFDVLIAADDGPWPVASVELLVDGTSVAQDTSEPWVFEGANFAVGSWTLVARATDLSGNVGESLPVEFFVGVTPPSDTGDELGETEESGESGSPSLVDDEPGCACTARPLSSDRASLVMLGLLLIGRIATRRKRSRAGRSRV